MTVKVVIGIIFVVLIFCGIYFFTNLFVDTVENFISQTSNIISAPDISAGIEAFYTFEESFYEAETFVSLFVHDSILEDIRISMVEIRTSFFNGERDEAHLFTSLLRERLLQLHRSILPSVVNIM